MSRYRNTFRKPSSIRGDYGPEFFETDAPPIEYKGFKIFQRIKGSVWDCVIDGQVIRMMAGLGGAKRFIDCYWEHQAVSAPGEDMPAETVQ